MKSLLFVILLIEAALLNAQDKKQYILDGNIKGKESGTIYLQYHDEGKKFIDSAKISNGHFQLIGLISEPVWATLADSKDKRPGNYSNAFDPYIEPGEMHISLSNNQFQKAKLTGSGTNDDWVFINNDLKPLYDSIHSLQDSDFDSNTKNALKYCNDEAIKKITDFINHNPNSVIAVKVIPWLSQFGVSNDFVLYLLDNLGDQVKTTYSFQVSRESVLQIINSAITHTAPDFIRKDMNGKKLKLSDLEGNYVLLDFWASWCEPCRVLTPHIKKLYKKYHSKGLEVVAISCDSKYEDWQKAIEKDSMHSFHNVLSFTDDDMNFLKTHDMYEASFKGELRKQYNLMPIPAQILIDKNGTIIGRYAAYDSPEEDLDKKLKQIFDG